MQDPFIHAPSNSLASQNVSGRLTSLKRLIGRHPYLSALTIFCYFQLVFLLLHFSVPLLIAPLHLSFLPRTLLGEVLLALVVAEPIVMLGWWAQTGFTRGINRRGLVVCIMPIVLIVLPVLCGLPALAGSASVSMLVITAILVLLIGFVEEGLCRGLLLRSLLPGGIWTSVLLSSVLFAGMHLFNLLSGFPWSYVAGQLLLAFGSGVLFAAVRLRTRSIWPSLLLHAAHDFPGLLLLTINPKLALSAPLNLVLIVNGAFCAFFILNAIVLLRPTQLRMLRIDYGLVPAPITPPTGMSYQLPPYPGYVIGPQSYPSNTPYPPPPSEYIQPPMVWPQPYSGDGSQPPLL